MDIDYSYQSPNYWADSTPVLGIVLHGTAGEALPSLKWLCRVPTGDDDGSSANYLIAKTGQIYCLVDPYKDRKAWANGPMDKPDTSVTWIAQCAATGRNPNRVTISIEHEALTDDMVNHRAMPDFQLAASIMLVKQLCRDFNLTPSHETIVAHRQIDAVNRANCPGVIDVPEYIEKVKENMPIDEPIQLNGFYLQFGFKATFLKFGAVENPDNPVLGGIKLFGYPLSNEFQGKDGKTYQVMERYVFGYQPDAPEEWKLAGGVVGDMVGADWLKSRL